MASSEPGTRETEAKNEIVREFAERLDGVTLADDIVPDDARYIVDAILHEMRQKRVIDGAS